MVVELDMSRNMISGGLDSCLFPNGTEGAKTGLFSLQRLLLQDTNMSGYIPLELGNCKNLTLIALDGSHFFGTIPSSFGNLSELTALRMAKNQLSGEIPWNIGSLTKLTDLRLFQNQLFGSVPQGIGNSSALTTLHIAENNFIGHLPQQVCRNGKLVNFTASYNKGSLANVLSSDEEAKELDWFKRVEVIRSVAHALCYMHHSCMPPIIHRDISSKNVLLNLELEAHVSDFGTARVGISNGNDRKM
ncbi:hypothetical protein ACSBR1_031178 [Camellia fascicularis]